MVKTNTEFRKNQGRYLDINNPNNIVNPDEVKETPRKQRTKYPPMNTEIIDKDPTTVQKQLMKDYLYWLIENAYTNTEHYNS